MRKTSLLFLVLFSALTAEAQTLTSSPYSRFGAGELIFQGFADQQGMGQTGVADRNPLRFSLLNPASYSAINKTNFRFGASSFFGTITQGNQSLATNGAGLNYVALGFQINKRKDWGVVFGITPYSAKTYDISLKIDSSFGSFQNNQEGRGGLYRGFLGTGKQFGDYLSVGTQISFIGGQSNYSRRLIYPENSGYLNYHESSNDYLYGFLYEIGAQSSFKGEVGYTKKNRYRDSLTGEKKIEKTAGAYRLQHNFGANFTFGSSLRANRDYFARTYALSGSREVIRDTILYDNSLRGTLRLPPALVVGYQLQENSGRFRVAAEYKFSFSNLYSSSILPENLENNYQVSVGAAWRPSVDFFNEDKIFLKKTEYRLGFRYGTLPVSLAGQSISELGISFGFGVPLRTRTVTEEFKFQTVFSSLDFSVEYLQRGTLNNNLIREEYWRFNIGVSLNDKWFNKRKIE